MIVGAVSKQPSEFFPLTINFTPDLATGETVVSAVVTSRNAVTGVDSTATICSGAATVATPRVTQKVTAGTNGDKHIITMLATTSASPVNKYEGEIELYLREE